MHERAPWAVVAVPGGSAMERRRCQTVKNTQDSKNLTILGVAAAGSSGGCDKRVIESLKNCPMGSPMRQEAGCEAGGLAEKDFLWRV